jgi:uracil-DNA glycosylase
MGEGRAKADVLFVGEAPGRTEAVTGRPFTGRIREDL